MSDVFISYSRRDQDAINKIQAVLKQSGIEYWIDQEDIGTGSRWDIQIQEGIQASHVVIVTLTNESVASPNVSDEWSYALEKGKHIIPVLIENCDVPMRIAGLQRIELVPDFDGGLEKLVDAIKKQLQTGAPKSVAKKIRAYKRPAAWPGFVKVGLACAFVLLGGYFGYDKFFSMVEVEDISGWNLKQAEVYLESKNLKIASQVYRHSPQDEDTVIKTEPEFVGELKRFSEVTLYITDKKLIIPDVVGMSRELAVKKLEKELGLTNVTVVRSISHSTGEYGNIIAMTPEANSKVTPDDEIKIALADKGGWVYLKGRDKEDVEEDDIVKVKSGYNLRKSTDSRSSDSKIDTLSKGTYIKVLKVRSDGWYKVRVVNQREV